MTDAEATPARLAQLDALAAALRRRGARIATAESCTGGLIAAACTALAGSSDWFERGFVTYSNEAKTELIGVPPALIAQHGAVSEPVARAMAAGALAHSRAQFAVAVTGIAGPGGAVPGKPVGTVWWALARRAGEGAARMVGADEGADEGAAPVVDAGLLQLAGDRAAVRAQTVDHALAVLLQAALA